MNEFKKGDLVTIIKAPKYFLDYSPLLKEYFNKFAVVEETEKTIATIILADGVAFKLPLDYLELWESDKFDDGEYEQIINNIKRIHSIHLDINHWQIITNPGFLLNILDDIIKRDFLLLSEDEEGFICTIEDYIFKEKLKLKNQAKILEFKRK